ncbi:DUF3866 family protein [Anaeromonas frigoriresistens]|uniref:DUF3866 family protein n=1 Tax=Anaeromonas frigoriresistens TaxID=2683708 RepID=UPI002078C445|nr:DUF3866 family protein [Anaeromonas frigoriresistens]
MGKITNIISEDKNTTIVEVKIGDEINKAINYTNITGIIKVDDYVIVNTTAVRLNLGTGGYHFIISILNNIEKEISDTDGHIMKMRYTPQQIRCSTLEEKSEYNKLFNKNISLKESIYAVGELHSMIEPLAASIKFKRPRVRICYIMTDGGALPINFSNSVKRLKEKSLIDKTITINHAFGGDYECINIYSALIAAKEIVKADVTLIAMGPGIVGTNTKYGFSGIEQAYILDGIIKLGGNGICIPRISFEDDRLRHIGISHHTITILSEIVNNRVNVVIPMLDIDKNHIIEKQLKNNHLYDKHNIYHISGEGIEDVIKSFNITPTSMGKNFEQNKDYYYALNAVGNFICSNYL